LGQGLRQGGVTWQPDALEYSSGLPSQCLDMFAVHGLARTSAPTVSGTGRVPQERDHRRTLVEVEPQIALRLGRIPEGAGQCAQCLRLVAVGVVRECLHYPDLQQAAVPSGAGRGCEQSFQ
jgi:hypothetical protein